MKKEDDKCRYCYYNTVLSCSEDPNECEDYEYNHLAEKYENKRYQVKWEDGNDVRVLMTDKLDEFPEWYFETVEDAEQLADHLNKKEELIQGLQDDLWIRLMSYWSYWKILVMKIWSWSLWRKLIILLHRILGV